MKIRKLTRQGEPAAYIRMMGRGLPQHQLHPTAARPLYQHIYIVKAGAGQPVTGCLAVGKTQIGVVDLFEVAADEDHLAPGILADQRDDGAVLIQAFGAELGHGAEDEDLAVETGGCAGGLRRCAGHGDAGEILDGGAHAGRIGIVGVEDDVVAIALDELRAAIGGGILFDAAGDAGIGNAEVFANSDGDQDIGQVVVADQLGMDGADGRAMGDLHAEEGGGVGGAGGGCGRPQRGLRRLSADHPGVGGIVGPIGDDMGDAAAHLAEIGRVAEDEGRTIVVAEPVIEFALALFDAFGSAETFEVGFADVGDDAMGGQAITAVSFNFFLVIGAHFDDSELRIGADRQDREGDADVVIQIALSGIGEVGGGEDGMDQLLRCGLAVAACYRDEWDIKLTAMMQGQLLQGRKHIPDEDEAAGLTRVLRRGAGGDVAGRCGAGGRDLINNGVGGAEFEGADSKVIAIEAGAFQGKEQIAFFEQTGVGDDRGVPEIYFVEAFDCHKTNLLKIWDLRAGVNFGSGRRVGGGAKVRRPTGAGRGRAMTGGGGGAQLWSAGVQHFPKTCVL